MSVAESNKKISSYFLLYPQASAAALSIVHRQYTVNSYEKNL